mmetsp:Transcript_57552/g.91525  ORF Transcript_57552/g.91525 Transcript_57552/m.91525 type:complete len:208 (-) Transcript_57552:78-701(-)
MLSTMMLSRGDLRMELFHGNLVHDSQGRRRRSMSENEKKYHPHARLIVFVLSLFQFNAFMWILRTLERLLVSITKMGIPSCAERARRRWRTGQCMVFALANQSKTERNTGCNEKQDAHSTTKHCKARNIFMPRMPCLRICDVFLHSQYVVMFISCVHCHAHLKERCAFYRPKPFMIVTSIRSARIYASKVSKDNADQDHQRHVTNLT